MVRLKIYGLIIYSLLCNLSIAQKTLTLDNNITGIYSKSIKGSIIGSNYVGNNSFDFNKKLSLDLVTSYSIRTSQQITENELIQRQVLDYHKENFDFFVFHQYNYSLLRKISADNQVGIGLGLKKSKDQSKVSLSYAILYQDQEFFDNTGTLFLRNSLRLKIKYQTTTIGFSTEIFYQPRFILLDDYIILSSTKITFLPTKKWNIILQDVINYRSISEVRTIHNLTIGAAFKLTKEMK